jgi:hypothetical protein
VLRAQRGAGRADRGLALDDHRPAGPAGARVRRAGPLRPAGRPRVLAGREGALSTHSHPPPRAAPVGDIALAREGPAPASRGSPELSPGTGAWHALRAGSRPPDPVGFLEIDQSWRAPSGAGSVVG